MARPRTQRPAPTLPENDPHTLDKANAALQHVAVQDAEADVQYGGGEPYDRGRVVREARWYLEQGAQAMIEAGRRLCWIKAREAHGDFTAALADIGIHERAARRCMSAALRFSSDKLAPKRTTLSVLGSSKMLELLSEDDDDLAALADGGELHGLKLDDIECMSVRELRAALREAKDKDKAKDELLSRRSQALDDASARLIELEGKVPVTRPWDERAGGVLVEMAGAYARACEQLDQLAACVAAIDALATDPAVQGAAYETLALDCWNRLVTLQQATLAMKNRAAIFAEPYLPALDPFGNVIDITPAQKKA